MHSMKKDWGRPKTKTTIEMALLPFNACLRTRNKEFRKKRLEAIHSPKQEMKANKVFHLDWYGSGRLGISSENRLPYDRQPSTPYLHSISKESGAKLHKLGPCLVTGEDALLHPKLHSPPSQVNVCATSATSSSCILSPLPRRF